MKATLNLFAYPKIYNAQTSLYFSTTIQVRYRKGPLSQKSAGHMQNSMRKLKLTLTLVLTLTDTEGAVLTLMLGYRS